MAGQQHLIGLGLGLDGSAGTGYSYALKQQQPMLPMLGGSSSLTDSKLLGMGISPYLTPPHSSIELDLGLSPDPNSGTNTIHASPSASPPSNPTAAPTALQQQIAISTAFYPGSSIFGRQFASLHPDLVVQSGDGVFFYIHLALILTKSQNGFGGLLPGSLVGAGAGAAQGGSEQTGNGGGASGYMDTPLLTPDCSEPTPPGSPLSATGRGRPSTSSSSSSSSNATPPSDPALPTLISLPESSGVINILFHVLYNTTSFARYSPDFETVSAVLPFMRKYGFDVAETLGTGAGSSNTNNGAAVASSEVMQTLLSFARERPLEVYTLAAQYGLRELAVAASPYTLDVSLSNLTDQQSVAMGPLYLKWLFFLHLGRAEALKRILVKPFEPHPAGLPGSTCTEDDRSAMGRAWGLVTAYILSLPSTQNMSVGSLSSTYGSLMGSVKCQRCKEQLGRTIEEIVRGWGGVQNTI
ncbi:hypothetical protein FRC04_003947 [Tulasnella sp. 424]|nr:hypothetical protein FRC04_003947 [Tulasnella sp. 424]KAG8965182.1 hypothetical protein FRC05_003325 [Tulasnella sp. 425]